MTEMTPEQIRSFLSAGTRTGKLAVVRRDGRPLVTPVWFVLDEDDVVFMTYKTSGKGIALRRDGRVSMVVDEELPPYAFVLLDGEVTISEDAGELLHWATVIGARYMGADRAEEYGRRNGVPGELVVRLRPSRIVAVAGIAD